MSERMWRELSIPTQTPGAQDDTPDFIEDELSWQTSVNQTAEGILIYEQLKKEIEAITYPYFAAIYSGVSELYINGKKECKWQNLLGILQGTPSLRRVTWPLYYPRGYIDDSVRYRTSASFKELKNGQLDLVKYNLKCDRYTYDPFYVTLNFTGTSVECVELRDRTYMGNTLRLIKRDYIWDTIHPGESRYFCSARKFYAADKSVLRLHLGDDMRVGINRKYIGESPPLGYSKALYRYDPPAGVFKRKLEPLPYPSNISDVRNIDVRRFNASMKQEMPPVDFLKILREVLACIPTREMQILNRIR